MSSNEEGSSRYVPPHRRQTPQQNRHHQQQSWTPQTTPRRFHQPSPSLPSSTRSHYNSSNRRRPRDSPSWTTPQKFQPNTPQSVSSSTTLSAAAPVWTPLSAQRPIIHHHPSAITKSQDEHTPQAESLFTRIVCINLIRRPDRWRTFQKRMRAALQQQYDTQDHSAFAAKVERFAAVDGQEVMPWYETNSNGGDGENVPLLPLLEWDATQNAEYDKHIQPPMTKQMTPGEVGCAMSHVQLWKELAEMDTTIDSLETIRDEGGENMGGCSSSTMLILEDDAILYQAKAKKNRWRRNQSQTPDRKRGRHSDASFTPSNNNNWRSNSYRSLDVSFEERHESDDDRIRGMGSTTWNEDGADGFIPALLDVWKILPKDWDILYLGMSDRGERSYVERTFDEDDDRSTTRTTLPVTLFRPTYGFHTHAYALTQKAARVLLENLPVQGPLDVWLADHQWFGLQVYCASIEDGTSFKGKLGAQLIAQQRHNSKSDIGMSGRVSM